jgi:hypothetical protein
MTSTSSHARRYDIFSDLADAKIEPVTGVLDGTQQIGLAGAHNREWSVGYADL